MKTTIIFLLITVNVITNSFSQNPGNALMFNANNGYCSAGLPTVFNNIASNDFTIECWVKPQSSSASKRVFFAQKNESNFCSILINGSNVPYLFISKNATSYSLNTQTAISTVAWTHLAFTWDASANTIKSYINGSPITGNYGGGSSSGSNGTMTIGARTDGQQIFKGAIDEFRVWSDIRTPCEVLASMNSEYTLSQPNLIASYSFNQGVAGGSNTGVTSLIELNSNYNSTLNGFTLSGANSNWIASGASIYLTNNNTETYYPYDVIEACEEYTWVDGNTYNSNNNTATHTYTSAGGCNSVSLLNLTINNSTTGTAVVTACNSYKWIDGITYTSNNNTATKTLVGGAANGCDSIVTLDLTVYSSPNTATTMSGAMITATESSASYKWINCFDNSVIIGEIGQSFTATTSGSYAVIVDDGNCVDTSSCVVMNITAVSKAKTNESLKIYPNPTNNIVHIETKQALKAVEIYNFQGKRVIYKESELKAINVQALSKGVYIMNILLKNGSTIKQRMEKMN